MTATTSANTIRVPCGDEDTTLEAAGVFVSFDLTRDVAYVVHECNSTLRWREISRNDAELLIAMGGRHGGSTEEKDGCPWRMTRN